MKEKIFRKHSFDMKVSQFTFVDQRQRPCGSRSHICSRWRELIGQTITTELKPGGANIHLTKKNKREYIELVNEWRFVNNVIKQMNSFIEGFTSLLPRVLLRMLDEN